LKASTTVQNNQFGSSVAISGGTISVGAPVPFDLGEVYVFVRNGSSWSQQASLNASNPGAGDGFGFSLAMAGDTIIVGAPSEGSNATGVNGDGNNDNSLNSGAAYVFVRNGTN